MIFQLLGSRYEQAVVATGQICSFPRLSGCVTRDREFNSRPVVRITNCPIKMKLSGIQLICVGLPKQEPHNHSQAKASGYQRIFGQLGLVYSKYVLHRTTDKPVSTDCSSLERILQLCHLRAFCAFSGGEDTNANHQSTGSNQQHSLAPVCQIRVLQEGLPGGQRHIAIVYFQPTSDNPNTGHGTSSNSSSSSSSSSSTMKLA